MRIEHINMTVVKIEDTIKFLKMLYPTLEIINSWEGKTEKGNERWAHVREKGSDSYFALEQADFMDKTRLKMNTFHGVNHFGLIVEGMKSIIKSFNEKGIKYSVAEAIDERVRVYCFDQHGFEYELIEYKTDDVETRFKYYNDVDGKAGVKQFLQNV
ncbi:MAG: hypothetical protein HRU38_12105 [Saccharospirillaceae bacterium]|nr:hypothetical protein [Pseudomonadales bacterium]NRB79391.1 hypothetical protein [Saccharospirillaceae bacterium]